MPQAEVQALKAALRAQTLQQHAPPLSSGLPSPQLSTSAAGDWQTALGLDGDSDEDAAASHARLAGAERGVRASAAGSRKLAEERTSFSSTAMAFEQEGTVSPPHGLV